jgi:sec-independent protein translocase protein TatB
MPQIGWFEIFIVVLLSIIIIGPKDFPIMIRKIGSWIGTFKSYFTEVQKDISDLENDFDKTSSINTDIYGKNDKRKKNE